jgi:hypothetical protein
MVIFGTWYMGSDLILQITPNKYGSLLLFKDGVQSEFFNRCVCEHYITILSSDVTHILVIWMLEGLVRGIMKRQIFSLALGILALCGMILGFELTLL